MVDPRSSALRQAYDLQALPDSGPQRSGFFVWNLAIDDDLPGWRHVDSQYSWLPGGRQHLSGVWALEAMADEQGCRLELTCHPARDEAIDDLAQRLGDLSVGRPEPRPELGLGELAWSSADRSLVAWLHGNLVGTAAVIDRDSASPAELALAVQRFLLQGAEPAVVAPTPARAHATRGGAAAVAVAVARAAVGRATLLPPHLQAVLGASRAGWPGERAALPYPVPRAEMAVRQDRPPMLRLLGEGGTVVLGPTGPDFVPWRAGQVRLSALVGRTAAGRASTAWRSETVPTTPIDHPEEPT